MCCWWENFWQSEVAQLYLIPYNTNRVLFSNKTEEAKTSKCRFPTFLHPSEDVKFVLKVSTFNSSIELWTCNIDSISMYGYISTSILKKTSKNEIWGSQKFYSCNACKTFNPLTLYKNNLSFRKSQFQGLCYIWQRLMYSKLWLSYLKS